MSAWLRRLPLVCRERRPCLGVDGAGARQAADNKTAAKEHYKRGTSFYDLGKYDDAIKEFEAAYQLKNDPAFLFNLAQSYRLAGNHERARALLQDLPALRPEGAQPRRHRREDQDGGEAGRARAAAGRPARRPTTTTAADDHDDAAARHDHAAAAADQPTVHDTAAGRRRRPATRTAGPPPPPATVPSRPIRAASSASPASRPAGRARVMTWCRHRRMDAAPCPRRTTSRPRPANGEPFDPDVQERGKSAETAQWCSTGLGVARRRRRARAVVLRPARHRRRRRRPGAFRSRRHSRPNQRRRHPADHASDDAHAHLTRAARGDALAWPSRRAAATTPNPESGTLQCGAAEHAARTATAAGAGTARRNTGGSDGERPRSACGRWSASAHAASRAMFNARCTRM